MHTLAIAALSTFGACGLLIVVDEKHPLAKFVAQVSSGLLIATAFVAALS